MDNTQNAIFISHATADDTFVRELRQQLEDHGLPVWVDDRNLRAGDALAPEIEAAIRAASCFVLVLGPHTGDSAWVQREVKLAEQVAAERGDDYCVIPLLLPGVLSARLGLWFDEPPVAQAVRTGPGDLSEAMAGILAALHMQEPDDKQEAPVPDAHPIDDLVIALLGDTLIVADSHRPSLDFSMNS